MLAIALHMTTNEGTFAKVSRILRDAELPEGRHHSNGGKALCALAGVDGYIVNKDWAKNNRDFLVKFVKVIAAAVTPPDGASS